MDSNEYLEVIATNTNRYLGAHANVGNKFVGFIHTFKLHEYCKTLTYKTDCTDCDTGCLDDGTCLSNCGINSLLANTPGGCVDCVPDNCTIGCTGSGSCIDPATVICLPIVCADSNCASCSEAVNQGTCYACAANFKLASYPPSTCVPCTDDCDTPLFASPPTCKCKDGFYYDHECDDCFKCHKSCSKCKDDTVFGCTACCGTDVLLPNSGYCSDTCPTGYAPTN